MPLRGAPCRCIPLVPAGCALALPLLLSSSFALIVLPIFSTLRLMSFLPPLLLQPALVGSSAPRRQRPPPVSGLLQPACMSLAAAVAHVFALSCQAIQLHEEEPTGHSPELPSAAGVDAVPPTQINRHPGVHTPIALTRKYRKLISTPPASTLRLAPCTRQRSAAAMARHRPLWLPILIAIALAWPAQGAELAPERTARLGRSLLQPSPQVGRSICWRSLF